MPPPLVKDYTSLKETSYNADGLRSILLKKNSVAVREVSNTGISLPFFSSGGTSLMMLLGEMGIVLSVSRGET